MFFSQMLLLTYWFTWIAYSFESGRIDLRFHTAVYQKHKQQTNFITDVQILKFNLSFYECYALFLFQLQCLQDTAY